ncbi:MAG TPA: 4Fe-4S binding protein [Chloroflexota bacterium]
MVSKSATRRKPRGLAKLWSIVWLRRAVQLYFVLFLTKVAVEKAIVGEESAVFVPSPEAYSPFGGVEGLYKFVTTSGLFIAHTHWSNLILAAGVVLTALVAKSAFCGWICPFGAIQEWIGAAARALGVGGVVPPAWADRAGRYLKYVVLIWATAGAGLVGTMVFRDVDPFHALFEPLAAGFGSSTIVLIVTLAASAVTERPWCKYACPLGALVGLMGRLSLLKVERDASSCTSCGLCDRKCPMGVAVSAAKRIATAECNNCLVCTEVCPRGSLDLKLVGLRSARGAFAGGEANAS